MRLLVERHGGHNGLSALQGEVLRLPAGVQTDTAGCFRELQEFMAQMRISRIYHGIPVIGRDVGHGAMKMRAKHRWLHREGLGVWLDSRRSN